MIRGVAVVMVLAVAAPAAAATLMATQFEIPEEIATAYFARTVTGLSLGSDLRRDYCTAYDMLAAPHRAAFTRERFAFWGFLNTPFALRPTLISLTAMPAVYDDTKRYAKVQLVGTLRSVLGGLRHFQEFLTLVREEDGWRVVLPATAVEQILRADMSRLTPVTWPPCPQSGPAPSPYPTPSPMPTAPTEGPGR